MTQPPDELPLLLLAAALVLAWGIWLIRRG